ncbi:MAG: type II toxin-antitoxin system ParD family antitoxin [Magnetococcales bacterium]|nr:type II toxin-antitoxin system ParD family antitoxin [Magnetococcales bacterium]
MQEDINITIDPHFEGFVAQQVATGRFETASEAVCAGLRLLEEQEIKRTVLSQSLRDGELSGQADYSLNKRNCPPYHELILQQVSTQ